MLNSQGKPELIVKAKQAGIEGARLRVRVTDVPALPPPAAPAGKKKEDEKPGETPAEPVGAAEASAFTLVVEREKASGGWKTEEMFTGVTLQEVETETGKQVRVAYRNNKAPTLVEVITPATKVALSLLWPREQEQTLIIEPRKLPATTSTEFQGDVVERSGVEGLEVLDNVTIVCVPDLMATAPGQKLDLTMVKAVQTAMIAHCERLGDHSPSARDPGYRPKAVPGNAVPYDARNADCSSCVS